LNAADAHLSFPTVRTRYSDVVITLSDDIRRASFNADFFLKGTDALNRVLDALSAGVSDRAIPVAVSALENLLETKTQAGKNSLEIRLVRCRQRLGPNHIEQPVAPLRHGKSSIA
jgi:hypothetical protein